MDWLADLLEKYQHLTPDIQYLLWLSVLPHVTILGVGLFALALRGFRNFDIFEPIYMTSGAALIGTTVRTFFIFLDTGNEDKLSNILGPYWPENVLEKGLIAINISMLIWVVFYYIGKNSSSNRSHRIIDRDTFLVVIKYVTIASLALNVVYLLQIDFFQNLNTYGISGKRFTVIGGDAENFTAYQYLKFGQDFSATAAILFACYYYAYDRSWRNFWILGTISLVAIIIPFIASIRGEIIYLAFSLLIVRHYLFKRTRFTQLLMITAVGMVLITYMQTLRMQSFQGRVSGGDFAIENTASVADAIVYSSHYICVGKTSVIMAKIPEEEPFGYGKSYLLTFIAPIPRVWWPEKPPVRIGGYVGDVLYERGTIIGGLPPGLIGEGWMNFGWTGIFLHLSVFGFICGYCYRRQIMDQGNDVFRVGLYAILWVTMLDVFSGDFTGDVMRFARYLIPYLIITRLAGMSRTKARLPNTA